MVCICCLLLFATFLLLFATFLLLFKIHIRRITYKVIMFCCETCHYQSNKKYNLQKHIKNVHKRDATDKELCDTQITSKITQITSKNTQITSQNDKNIFTCQKCFKNFKTFHGYSKHQIICKGVSNVLECHHCHKVLATQQSKSKHLKICKMKEVKELVEKYTQNITNNTQNNTNTQNIIVNYHNYRGPYHPNAYYDTDNYDDITGINNFGHEDMAYITDDEMLKFALNYDIKGLITQKHFNPEHPENHNIRDNCRKSYKILKNNEWTVETKDAVHSIIYNNSQCKIHDYAFTNLLNKILDEEKTDEYLDKIHKLDDKVHKKRMYDYIDVKIKELMKKIAISKLANGIESNDNKCITLE